MRHLVITLSLLFAAGCEGGRRSTPAQLEILRPNVDLGLIRRGAVQTVTFLLNNVGGSDLKILQLESSCRCTETNLSRDTIPAGEHAVLRIVTRPDDSGDHAAAVTVYSNTDSGTAHRVAVSWTAVSPVDVVPFTLDLGTLFPSSSTEAAIEIVARPALLENSEPCRVAVLAEADPSVRCSLPARDFFDRVQGTVHIDADDRVGEFLRTVKIQCSGGWSGTLELPVRWRVGERLMVSPRRLSLGIGTPGSAVEAAVRISSPTERFDIAGVVISEGTWSLEAEVVRENEKSAQVRVRGELPIEGGIHRREVTVQFRASEITDVTIPVSAVVRRDAPQLLEAGR